MAQRMYRAQLLLQPEIHRRLRQIAERENRSISDVSRELLEEALNRREQERSVRLRSLRAAHAVAQRILQEREGRPLVVDVAEVLNQEREKRAHELGGD